MATAGVTETRRSRFIGSIDEPPSPLPTVRIAIYAGSFDPITNGHIDIIRHAALFALEKRVKPGLSRLSRILIGLVLVAVSGIPGFQIPAKRNEAKLDRIGG